MAKRKNVKMNFEILSILLCKYLKQTKDKICVLFLFVLNIYKKNKTFG